MSAQAVNGSPTVRPSGVTVQTRTCVPGFAAARASSSVAYDPFAACQAQERGENAWSWKYGGNVARPVRAAAGAEGA